MPPPSSSATSWKQKQMSVAGEPSMMTWTMSPSAKRVGSPFVIRSRFSHVPFELTSLMCGCRESPPVAGTARVKTQCCFEMCWFVLRTRSLPWLRPTTNGERVSSTSSPKLAHRLSRSAHAGSTAARGARLRAESFRFDAALRAPERRALLLPLRRLDEDVADEELPPVEGSAAPPDEPTLSQMIDAHVATNSASRDSVYSVVFSDIVTSFSSCCAARVAASTSSRHAFSGSISS